jgi:predicted DNA-binding transcriptional regulator YafY
MDRNQDRNKGNGLKNQGKHRRAAPVARHEQASVEERIERGYSRPPLARMLRIHEWLMGHRYPNCRKIAEEFEVSAKTVQRDVNFMRDQLGLPIEYDKARFGFQYTRAVTGFPSIALSGGKSAAKIRENPWRKSPPPAIGEKPSLAAEGTGSFAARIRFDADSARAVRGRAWHATQVIRALPDGGVEVTMRVRDEWEIARWVLSWGAHAWVVEPAPLRNRVRELAREILARH